MTCWAVGGGSSAGAKVEVPSSPDTLELAFQVFEARLPSPERPRGCRQGRPWLVPPRVCSPPSGKGCKARATDGRRGCYHVERNCAVPRRGYRVLSCLLAGRWFIEADRISGYDLRASHSPFGTLLAVRTWSTDRRVRKPL